MSATSYVQGQAGRIEVRLLIPQHAKANVFAVVCHPHPLYGGSMDNKVVTTLTRTFKDLAIPVVSFNFRGVGQSEGLHDYARGEAEDLLAVIAWAAQQTQAEKLYLAGFSFGSYVAAVGANRLSHVQLQQLLLVAPPVHHYAFNELALPIEQTLVIQGDADEVVPAQEVFDWAAQQQITVLKFPNCSHFFHGRLVELRQAVLENLV